MQPMQTTGGYAPCTSAEPAEPNVVTVVQNAPCQQQGGRCGPGKGRRFKRKMKRCCCLLFVVLTVMMAMLAHLVHQTGRIYHEVKDDENDYPGGSATAFCSDLCVRMCLHERRAPTCEVLHCRASCLRSIDDMEDDGDDDKKGYGYGHVEDKDEDGDEDEDGDHEGHDGHGHGKGHDGGDHDGEDSGRGGDGKGKGGGGEGHDEGRGGGEGKGGEGGDGDGKGRPPMLKMMDHMMKRRFIGMRERKQIAW